MTGKQIREDALLYAAVGGYNADEVIVAGYIDRAVERIALWYREVGKKKTEAYDIDSTNVNTWIDLPTDFLFERRLYETDAGSTLIDANYEPYEYLIENEQIRFDFAGKYTMEYVAIPDPIGNINNSPNINALWHPAISYYVAYRIKAEIFGDEEGEKNELFMRFKENCQEAAARLNSRKRRKIVKAPFWG